MTKLPTLRDGCEPPRQPRNETAADQRHPLYPEYCRYRAAMAEQLVTASAFDSWLRMREQADDDLDERTRFDPRTGQRMVYDSVEDASEHRLRLMEEGITHLDLEEPDHGDSFDDGFDDDSDFEEDDE